MRKVALLMLLLIPTQEILACPPTGHHLGVIIRGSLPVSEVITRLQGIGISAKHQVVRHSLTSGGYASFDTVVFSFGQWLPSEALAAQPIEADARLYIGKRSMALKVNTSLSGSFEPIRRALALLYKAGVIDYLPEERDYVLTEGNVIPADVVVMWARREYGYELEQLVLRCRSKGAEVMVSSTRAKEEVVVLANSVDAELSYPALRDALMEEGFNPKLVGPEEFREHMDAELIIVLGGPEAYEGVGNLSKFLLPSSDSDYLIMVEDSYVVYMAQPLFEGQLIFVLAGHDRYGTRQAVKAFIEGPLKEIRGPVLRYEFSTTHAIPARNVVRGYPCMVFIEVFSTLPTPCYKALVTFELNGNEIYVKVDFVELPVTCIQVITTGDVRIYISQVPPGEYDVRISTPDGEFMERVSVPPC